MAYNPEKVGEQKIDDQQIGKAQQRIADEQRHDRSQQAMGSRATAMAEAQSQEEEQGMGM